MAKGAPSCYDVAIVGAGLSGLVVAAHLPSHVTSVLLEANRATLGGRLCNSAEPAAGISADLGGAWVWPQQHRVLRLIRALRLATFPQPGDPSSLRIVGGAFAIARALAERRGADAAVRMGWPVVAVERGAADGPLALTAESGEKMLAWRVVFAVPPRLLSKSVSFRPALDRGKWQEMLRSRTWMAGVTKVVLVYVERFWKLDSSTNMGLRNGLSRPAFQVYDAGGPAEEPAPAALTFFALAQPREIVDDKTLASQCAHQLADVWSHGYAFYGSDAIDRLRGQYSSFVVQRWPEEIYISDDPKPSQINPHPEPVQALGASDWGGRLLFAGSEADQNCPGMMEGAVGAAEAVLSELETLSNDT